MTTTMTALQAAAFQHPLLGARGQGERFPSQRIPPWIVALSFNR